MRGESRNQAWLFVFHRNGAQMVELRQFVPVIIGRLAPADVAIPDVSLSRLHAKVEWQGGAELTVEDMGSTNGTFVDGHAIERATVQVGEEITLGGVTVTLHHVAAESSPKGFAGHERFCALVE